jgi:hypothetical protein
MLHFSELPTYASPPNAPLFMRFLLASPPGKGQSSPTVNVLWGTLNVGGGYFLVCHVGEFQKLSRL